MMKAFAAMLISSFMLGTALPASAQIDVPYFKKMSKSDVCGGFNSYCQPASSIRYDRVRGADFVDLAEWLGTSYPDKDNSVFQRSSCTAPFEATDVIISGENNFSVSVNNAYTGQLHSKLDVDVAKYLAVVLEVLPGGLAAKLKADATDKLALGNNGKADLTYRRYDLKMTALGRLLPACYAKTKGLRRVITGVSVISMSGSWSRSRLIDSFGAFEATADFIGLEPDIKAKYTDRRAKALEGQFKPMSFIIATAWRTSD